MTKLIKLKSAFMIFYTTLMIFNIPLEKKAYKWLSFFIDIFKSLIFRILTKDELEYRKVNTIIN